MTPRKPAGMSFETWVDQQISQAQPRGEFGGLPGEGKPLRPWYPDDTAYQWVLEKARPFIVTSDYRPADAQVRSGLLRERLRDPQRPVQMGLW